MFRKNKKFIILFLTVLIILILYNFFKEKKIPVEYLHYQSLLQKSGTRNSTCKIPQLNPWDQTILSYFSKPKRIQCKPFLLNVTYLDENGILNITLDFIEKVNCEYRYFFKNDGVDDDNLVYDEWISFDKNGVKLVKEFVEVKCVTKSILSGSYTYQFAHLKPKTTNIKKKPILDENVENPSVIMIGLDSMSKSNFIRQLPHTYQYLQKNDFIDLQSHVKVADNTYNNWLAILSGKLGTKTREFEAELPDEFHLWFDDWNFIWKNYSDHGYATLFAEDRVDIATFNYMGKQNGFRYSPVDHYFRPFWLSCYWSLTFRRSTTGCYDRKPLHKIQFEYLEQFLKGYEKKRKFAWWWTQDLSHDDLNSIGAIDLDFREILKKNEKLLENSIVIIFSDHGHRYAQIRETMIGRLEARLPYLTIRIPKNLQKKHPWIVENLKYNSKWMTTQYDLHQTLLHILDKFDKNADVVKPKKIQRAFSLFRKVQKDRSCYEAWIPEDYCPCFEEVEIPISEAKKPAQILLEFANKLIFDFNKFSNVSKYKKQQKFICAKLELKKIQYASIKLPPQKLIQDPQVKEKIAKTGIEFSYRIVVECQPPSNAIIEGIIIKNLDFGQWLATGEIERNNKYGNSSICVENQTLKKICHCLSAN